MRFHLSVMLSILIGTSLGCASSKKDIRLLNEYRNLSRKEATMLPEEPVETVSSKTTPLSKSDEYERLGDISFSTGKLHMAFLYYEKSFALKPDNTRVIYKKGLALLLGKMNEEAITAFNEVLEKDPKYAPAYEGLGLVFFQMKNYDKAEKNFLKAIELNPRLWKPYNYLGVIFDYRKKYVMAVHQYSAAISLKPGEGLLYNNMGVSFLLAGDYNKAISAFNKALENSYIENRTYNNLGVALSKVGRYQEAYEAFKKGGNEAQVQNNLGCVYLTQNEYKNAVTCFERALEASPTYYCKAGENLRRAMRKSAD